MDSEQTGRANGHKSTRVGTVTSDAMDKTVVVGVDRFVLHPVYKKIIRRSRKFMAHDEANECKVGDRIRIMECRPLSRHKRWRVVEIIAKAK